MPDEIIAVLVPTDCDTLIVYVPAPPVPERIAVMVVPVVTLEPDAARTIWPTASVPEGDPVTVSVEPAIVPMSEMAPVPDGQKEPIGHAVPEADVAAAMHQYPALHGFALSDALPVAVQKPALHVVHAP